MGQPAKAQMPYLDRPLPRGLIFGSFFVVFLPLCVLSIVPNFVSALPYLLLAEVVGLGVSHFFITLLLYAQAQNLDHFASSARNRLIYFAAPLLLLLLFAAFAALGVDRTGSALALYFFAAIRFFDFFHVGRQSFGMLQLFKRPVGALLPAWSRRAENGFFVGMALLQWETFAMGGRFQPDVMHARLPAVMMGALFVAVAASYLQLPAGKQRREGLRPLTYFGMQALCAAVAVYDTRLYAVGLTLHYVEYHVMMAPRCLDAPLDESRAVDRAYRPLRDNAPLLYAALILVVLTFEARNHVPDGLGTGTTFFVHIFDGIFFVHYFVEAFLWKFKEPFYARTLGPLYFPKPGNPAPQRTRGRFPWPSVGVLAGAALILGVSGALGKVASAVEARVVAPLDAENHVRWAVELSRDGDAERARAHARYALEREPAYEPAQTLLRSLDAASHDGGARDGATSHNRARSHDRLR